VKRAILPSIFAWIVGVTVFLTYSYMTRNRTQWTSTPPVQEFFQALMFIGSAVAIVVFPTCLLIVTPLLKLLPRSSFLWRPAIAAVVGAVTAPLAMYLWAAGFLRHTFAPDIHNEAHLAFAATSVLVGITFAFSYATSIRNTRNAS